MQIDKDIIHKNIRTWEVCRGDPTVVSTAPAGTTGRRHNGNTKTREGRLSVHCKAPQLLISTVNVITIQY